jgi:hypothetical protein
MLMAKKQTGGKKLYGEMEKAGKQVPLDPNMARNKIGYGGMKPINLTKY